MSNKKQSLKSKPSLQLRQRCNLKNLIFPLDERLYSETRPPYKRHTNDQQSFNVHNLPVPLDERLDSEARPQYKRSRNDQRINSESQNYRRNSLNGNISLNERLKNYHREATKQRDTFVHHSGYQENVPINERIAAIENRLAKKPRQVLKSKYDGRPLRVASPERAKELVRRHFENLKQRRNSVRR